MNEMEKTIEGVEVEREKSSVVQKKKNDEAPADCSSFARRGFVRRGRKEQRWLCPLLQRPQETRGSPRAGRYYDVHERDQLAGR